MIKQLLFLFTFITFHLTAIGQPNFVIVILDDQGWTGSSVQMDAGISDSKSDYYLTPEIEKLAKQGMIFSQGYAPAPKCAPSRCSILTGRTTARNNFTNTDNNIATDKILIEPNSETSLNGEDMTYAEWLKSIGMNYRTAHFGKWHLGASTASSPGSNGFDFNDGSTNNGDGNNGGTVQTDPKKMFDLTTRSMSFMESAVNDQVPFALQLSHYSVHNDIEARQETIDKYNDASQRPKGQRHDNADYGAMTEDTDDAIGQLLAKITSLGIDDNTYVFFISDNGGQINFTDNTPLSFGKTFIYEGGIRVPFIVKGPNITADSYNTEAVVAYDLFPTIAELTGSTEALPENMDGQSLVPLLTGNNFSRTKPLYFHSPHYEDNPNKKPRSAVVDGKYKLVVDYETGNTSLYDLSADIEEDNDLSSSQPALALELRTQLRDHLKSVGAAMPTLDPTNTAFPGSGTDVDDDGLEDTWELRELLSYTYGPNDDPDNDGDSNLTEFIAGTDPYSGEVVSGACDKTTIFANKTTNAVCWEEIDQVRKCYTNNIPAHEYGPFGGANTIEGQDFEYSMCLNPEMGDTTTELIEDPDNPSCSNGIIFGVSDQGINYSPFARLYFTNPTTNEENKNFIEEADFLLNMDLNGGHVNAVSRYHYHNIPSAYFVNDLNIDGTQHSPLVGYAADGFPIYYKYLYNDGWDSSSGIGTFDSSFTLKSGNRTGDGVTAPNGAYDGTYIQDYEYNAELSELDECGGRFGVTPDYSNGTYYYVMTDKWPFIPRCLKGKYVDNSFRLGQACPSSTALQDCSVDEIMWEESTNPPVEPPPILAVNTPNLEFFGYPNPAVNCIKISGDDSFNEQSIESIKIYDLNAHILYQSDYFENEIDVSRMVAGTYFLQVDSNRGQVTKRIIIQ